MKKKGIYIILFHVFFSFSLFMISCSQKDEIKVVEDIYPNGQEKVVRYYAEEDNVRILIREISFYENGNKTYEGTFKNNVKHGNWKYWYENGSIWSEGEYENGIASGKKKVYYPNGSLYYTGIYKNGEQYGKWLFYNENGSLVKEIIY